MKPTPQNQPQYPPLVHLAPYIRGNKTKTMRDSHAIRLTVQHGAGTDVASRLLQSHAPRKP